VCGTVTGAKALSSKPGKLLPADAGPKSQPALNGTVRAAGDMAANRRGVYVLRSMMWIFRSVMRRAYAWMSPIRAA
jgi:hypothetical protein